ncbi:MAG TPA: hypothetical protein VE714_12620 [Gemmatimonadales bacterium]|jgi:aminoglycoside phosphotransferase|nr:hypothetical protein [Gemmatimonadales bacterium]
MHPDQIKAGRGYAPKAPNRHELKTALEAIGRDLGTLARVLTELCPVVQDLSRRVAALEEANTPR